jgi:hypothetical protein
MTTKQPIGRFSGLGLNPKRLAGPQSRRLQRLRAGRFGAAGRGRKLDDAERRAVRASPPNDITQAGILPASGSLRTTPSAAFGGSDGKGNRTSK